MKYFVTVNGRAHEVDLVQRDGGYAVRVDGKPVDLAYQEVDDLGQVLVLCDGRSHGLSIEAGEGDGSELAITLAGHFHDVHLEDERERAAHAAERDDPRGGGVVLSIMPGVVVEVLVARGAKVEKGQPLLILSAMKMQNEIAAPSAGIVREIHVGAGQAVSTGGKLVTLAEA